jgi:hypothetical protein
LEAYRHFFAPFKASCISPGVAGVHGDKTRPVNGLIGYMQSYNNTWPVSGVFGAAISAANPGGSDAAYSYFAYAHFKSGNVVPTGPANVPRAWGALACVYLGLPAS